MNPSRIYRRLAELPVFTSASFISGHRESGSNQSRPRFITKHRNIDREYRKRSCQQHQTDVYSRSRHSRQTINQFDFNQFEILAIGASGTVRNYRGPPIIAIWEAYGIIEGNSVDAQETICGNLERGLRRIDPRDDLKAR